MCPHDTATRPHDAPRPHDANGALMTRRRPQNAMGVPRTPRRRDDTRWRRTLLVSYDAVGVLGTRRPQDAVCVARRVYPRGSRLANVYSCMYRGTRLQGGQPRWGNHVDPVTHSHML